MKKRFSKKFTYGLIAIFLIILGMGCVKEDESQTATSPNQNVDTTAPVIECTQEAFSLAETAEKGDYAVSLTAHDEIDGDLTEKITVDDSEVQYGIVGTYTIKASVSDSSGNKCEKIFDVNIKDTTAPTLSFTTMTFTLTEGDGAPNYAGVVTANDSVDGNITGAVVIDDSSVNYNSAGTYEVTYTITDNSGNSATQKVTVTIKEKVSTSSASTSSVQVMITKTGECYHTHKCGNGTYFWVSFDEAKSRGLRPCQKCY
ncbi:MAG: DUF5011 domain-containing protein [Tyzzerella sp.]|nr:DUF5011 domain-containing protein [Tyzzerella sp.]